MTFPPGNDDLPFDADSDFLELEYMLNHDPIKDMDSSLEDSVDKNSLDDNLDDTISEMFIDGTRSLIIIPPSGILKMRKEKKSKPWDIITSKRGSLILLLPSAEIISSVHGTKAETQRFPGFLKPLVLAVFVLRSQELQVLSFILGIRYPSLID
ncbi:hypothetical protein Tco_0195464 [Tanacetum coccineum]